MPFGMCNAPATFQRVMNEVLKDRISKNLLVYLDDITVFTRTLDEHLNALQWVFQRLRAEELFLKPKKYTFATYSMKFLGYIIITNRVTTDLDKIQPILRFPSPRSHTEVRTFLGLTI